MGLFKQIKDMKDMAHEAPGLMAQSTQLAAAAQANAAAQQQAAAVAMTTAPVVAPSATDAESISGVDLALFAAISKAMADVGYDQARGPEVAARHGVDAARWQMAMEGWNARIVSDPSVASRFNALYTGR